MNNDESLTKRIQEQEILMLDNFKRIMEKNNIPFYLACGTALGCVRHKGYIPWDDDVDIYILGRDYYKLKKVFATQDTGNLVLEDYDTENYPYFFPKIVNKDTTLVENALTHLDYKCGLYIDIFLLMETSDNPVTRFFSEKRRYFTYALLKGYYYKFESGVDKIISKIAKRLCNPKKLNKSLYKMYTKKTNGTKYLIDICTFKEQALLDASIFKDTIQMEFENIKFPMAIGYEKYLTHYYGDYMSLPPVEARVSNHNFAELELNDGKGE